MIQLQYREMSIEQKPWEVYGQANILTKDMKQARRELQNNDFRFYETRVVDTKKNPELVC